MSTDWSTNRNKQFGKNELYLNMSNTIASVGLKLSDSESIENVRNIFYNIYKRHGLCNNDGKWYLFDRYITSNDYTGNKFDNLIVLNSSLNVNINRRII